MNNPSTTNDVLAIPAIETEPSAPTPESSDDEVPFKKLCKELEVPTSQKAARKKYKKFALLTSFCGVKYLGMQINGETPTIEKELFTALQKADIITPEERLKPSSFKFQRAARTDKHVSAVAQVCSLQIPCENGTKDVDFLPRINRHLPPEIRILGIRRVTKGFDAKNTCDSRTYSYTLPTYAFTKTDELTQESFRLTEERRAEVNDVLDIYRGTHNFYNFTSNRKSDDASCRRYVLHCECQQPFTIDGVEFATILIRGQSFMLHQIRKMIGLAIAIVRGLVPKSIIQRAWEPVRLDVPKAPGLGLMLDQLHYDWYNKKFAKTHDPLEWADCQADIEKFKAENIVPVIYKGETEGRSMFEWLKNLPLHTFDVREEGTSARIEGPLMTATKLIEQVSSADSRCTDGAV